MVEPLRNSVQVPYTPSSHCVDEVREGSVQSNHSELTSKTSTHLSFSEIVYRYPTHLVSKTSTHLSFSALKKVRGGSLWLNHSETVYRYPTHLVTPL